MTFVLIILGILFLFIIGKITFDKYMIINATRDLKQKKPEGAINSERNNKIDINVNSKSRIQDKRDTLNRLADNLGCSPSKVKENYFLELKNKNFSAAQIKQAILISNQKKYEESMVLNIHPEDTAFAFMEKWATEFFENRKYVDRKRTVKEMSEDFFVENPELNEIAKSGNEADIQDYLKNNPKLYKQYMEDFAYIDIPSERYRVKAIEKIFMEQDYIGAIELINEGLEIDDTENNPSFYELRADCKVKLLKYKKALKDLNKAYKLIKKLFPHNYLSLGDILNKRAKVKKELGNHSGSSKDKKKADEYNSLYEDSIIDDDN
jgi:hypothetical protein